MQMDVDFNPNMKGKVGLPEYCNVWTAAYILKRAKITKNSGSKTAPRNPNQQG